MKRKTKKRAPSLRNKMKNKKDVRHLLSNPDNIRREILKRSLFEFAKEFWSCISAAEPVWNWHIEHVFCPELEKVARRVGAGIPNDYDLVFNVPPGTTKSSIISQLFPVWCWVNWNWMRFITTSYGQDLAFDHSSKSRDIIRSKRFRRYFPEIKIRRDKDSKSAFNLILQEYDEQGNEREQKIGGDRLASSVGGKLTGFHGHFLIADDPLNPEQAASEKELKTANRWVRTTLSTRKADKQTTTMIIVMQRLHQNDPSGDRLADKKLATRHICLPCELSNGSESVVSPPELIEFYTDGLLDVNRMPKSALLKMEAELGQLGYACQGLQNPKAAGAALFEVDKINIIPRHPAPNEVQAVVRAWDKAATESTTSAYTAGVLLYLLKSGFWVIGHVARFRVGTEVRESNILSIAKMDGLGVQIFMEQEPGSSGLDSVRQSIRNLAPYRAEAKTSTGSKVQRADAFSVQVNRGNVSMVQGAWNETFISEMEWFPMSTYKDQVDAVCSGFNYLGMRKKVQSLDD